MCIYPENPIKRKPKNKEDNTLSLSRERKFKKLGFLLPKFFSPATGKKVITEILSWWRKCDLQRVLKGGDCIPSEALPLRRALSLFLSLPVVDWGTISVISVFSFYFQFWFSFFCFWFRFSFLIQFLVFGFRFLISNFHFWFDFLISFFFIFVLRFFGFISRFLKSRFCFYFRFWFSDFFIYLVFSDFVFLLFRGSDYRFSFISQSLYFVLIDSLIIDYLLSHLIYFIYSLNILFLFYIALLYLFPLY